MRQRKRPLEITPTGIVYRQGRNFDPIQLGDYVYLDGIVVGQVVDFGPNDGQIKIQTHFGDRNAVSIPIRPDDLHVPNKTAVDFDSPESVGRWEFENTTAFTKSDEQVKLIAAQYDFDGEEDFEEFLEGWNDAKKKHPPF